MINRQFKTELMDAVQSAVSAYLSTTRGAQFAGATAQVKRSRPLAVLITGIPDPFEGTRQGLEIVIDEIKS